MLGMVDFVRFSCHVLHLFFNHFVNVGDGELCVATRPFIQHILNESGSFWSRWVLLFQAVICLTYL